LSRTLERYIIVPEECLVQVYICSDSAWRTNTSHRAMMKATHRTDRSHMPHTDHTSTWQINSTLHTTTALKVQQWTLY